MELVTKKRLHLFSGRANEPLAHEIAQEMGVELGEANLVDFANGARGMLDLCMFAEGSRNEQEICVVGDEGKIESLVTESLLRVGRRKDGIHVVTDHTIEMHDVRHIGLHHGSSYLEHVGFLDAIRAGKSAEVTLLDGLWSVAVGVAAHRSIETGLPVDIGDLDGMTGVEFQP